MAVPCSQKATMYEIKNPDGTVTGPFKTRADAYVSIVNSHRQMGMHGELTMQHAEDDEHAVYYFNEQSETDDAPYWIVPIKS